nr:adomet-dependent rrna methyltransferase spb1 [Quercus suber]
MAIQKKHAKARLDKYYYLAKEKGYRARAAFKLIQLNKKFGFLQQSKCLIDLCAAPGSWLQVAAETMPVKSLIVGVDLSPIKPIPKTITFQGDITTDKTRAIIRGHLKSWKADTVIHDGAPNVGTAWVQDAFSQNELVLCSLKLATEFLAPNGNFVTKVFRSKDSAKLEWIFKQLFAKVDQTKPPSSRNVSAETFYVCRGFKAPKNLDPRFLDPRHAFAEVEEAAVNMEARVFNPEKKKRKRDGYEEGDWTQFHEVSASEFVQTQDPIAMLGALNKIHFRQDGINDISQSALDKLPETSEEVRLCCDDLKVLGRKEFKLLLRWRLKARDRFGMRIKKPGKEGIASQGPEGEEVAVLESMDDEMKLQEELQNMTDKQNKIKRKERRKENERKNREIVRMQMNMTTPTEIGIEAGGPEDGTFRLKDVDKAGIGRDIARGRMHTAVESLNAEESEAEELSDEDGDLLERELDGMYEQYQERREDRDTKARAKRARQKGRGEDDEDFEGFSGEEQNEDEVASSDDDLLEDDDDDDKVDSDDRGGNRLLSDLQPRDEKQGELTRRAISFFQQDLFQGLGDLGIDEEDESESDAANILSASDKEMDSGVDVASPTDLSRAAQDDESMADFHDEEEDEDATSQTSSATIEGVPRDDDEENWDSGDEAPAATTNEGRPNIDIITAEAMTLAHALATGKTTKYQLLDDNFNKFSHRDTDGLPEWFLDDENKHSRMVRPISAEAAKAIQEKTKALNARPIKKVREAKARKTLRTARRLEKLKKKSEGLAEGDDLSERDKANNIAALMAKAKSGGAKRKRPAVKVVRAGGQNKGAGRPKGVKGKYKMVDPRLKKDVRGLKRAEKKQKKKKSR